MKKDPALEKWISFRQNPHFYFRPSKGSTASLIFFMGIVPFTVYCIFLNFHVKTNPSC